MVLQLSIWETTRQICKSSANETTLCMQIQVLIFQLSSPECIQHHWSSASYKDSTSLVIRGRVRRKETPWKYSMILPRVANGQWAQIGCIRTLGTVSGTESSVMTQTTQSSWNYQVTACRAHWLQTSQIWAPLRFLTWQIITSRWDMSRYRWYVKLNLRCYCF